MAVYDVTSMPLLETPTYTSLRANRSAREADTISQVAVTRLFFDLHHTKQSPLFVPIETLTDEEAHGLITVAVEMTLTDAPGAQDEYTKWYTQEHVELLSKVPGWLRSRFFKTSSVENPSKKVLFMLHDYQKDNGLGGPEHTASMDTPWRTQVFDKYVANKSRQTFSLFYVFGPGPRDLESLSQRSADAAFTSPDKATSTDPSSISSYITASDGTTTIPYRLEGNPSPSAPTIAFSNSLLTSLAMWDPLIAILKQHRPDLRILRYDFRGRHATSSPATLPAVTSDLLTLLDGLRITKLHVLVGVSMGGVTTLNFALTHPDRVGKFVAADFNCTSSDANTQAWKDRTALAREDNGQGIKKLADQTVERWFHPASMEKKELVSWMTDIVASNDVEGFANSNTVLWDYDLKPTLESCKVPGLLVCGEADAKGGMVKAMNGFKDQIGKGVELRLVKETGHLPMCENPAAFWKTIEDFL